MSDSPPLSHQAHSLRRGKKSIEMDKPIYIGTSILDLSKSLMYDNYYNNLKSKYKDNVSLLCMETDSFILETRGHSKEMHTHANKHIICGPEAEVSPGKVW